MLMPVMHIADILSSQARVPGSRRTAMEIGGIMNTSLALHRMILSPCSSNGTLPVRI